MEAKDQVEEPSAEVKEPAAPPPPEKPGLRERISRLGWKAKVTSVIGAISVVALFLGLFGLSLVDVWHWAFPKPPACPRHPADRPALSLANPQMETAVRGVLREYSVAYGRHDEVALGRVLSSDLCRYVDTNAPTRKEESVDTYRAQFQEQRAGGEERVRYSLVGPRKPPPGTGGGVRQPKGPPVVQIGENEAVVYAFYRIETPPKRQGKNKQLKRELLGDADIRFHVRQKGGTLLIDEIKAG